MVGILATGGSRCVGEHPHNGHTGMDKYKIYDYGLGAPNNVEGRVSICAHRVGVSGYCGVFTAPGLVCCGDDRNHM